MNPSATIKQLAFRGKFNAIIDPYVMASDEVIEIGLQYSI